MFRDKSLLCNALMLLATESFAFGRQAFAARQMNSANLATNHIFRARSRLCLIGIAAPCAVPEHRVGDDKDCDQKQELGQDPHHLPVDC